MHGGNRVGSGHPERLQTPDGLKGKYQSSLEFAMAVINDPDAPLDAKIRIAIAAMPFQHAKLAEQPATKKTDAESAADAAAKGRFAAPAGPKLAVNNRTTDWMTTLPRLNG